MGTDTDLEADKAKSSMSNAPFDEQRNAHIANIKKVFNDFQVEDNQEVDSPVTPVYERYERQSRSGPGTGSTAGPKGKPISIEMEKKLFRKQDGGSFSDYKPSLDKSGVRASAVAAE